MDFQQIAQRFEISQSKQPDDGNLPPRDLLHWTIDGWQIQCQSDKLRRIGVSACPKTKFPCHHFQPHPTWP